MGIISDMDGSGKDFTDILLDRGHVADQELDRARGIGDATGEALHIVLSKLGIVAENVVADAVAEQLEVAPLADGDFPATALLSDQLSADFLQSYRVLPISEDHGTVVVAMANPFDDETVQALELKLGKQISRRVATPFQLDRQISRLLQESGADSASEPQSLIIDQIQVERLREMASEAPIVRTANLIIENAITIGASDIHIEPAETGFTLRRRVDGHLRKSPAPDASVEALVSRIKIMAGLDIVERRKPQDGRCRVSVQGRHVDIRVSCLPTVHGEGVVLRILDKAQAPLQLEILGLSEETREGVESIIAGGNGIFLATGPTGSGKTTTLYAALQRLNTENVKLVTVEDPVEYQLEGITQIQVNPGVGVSFADALRSVLRHDPDIIMIGEIRDLETARIAVQSALTGHVVLSTLHTDDAAGAITRLKDMGVEPYLITSAVKGVVAQRLVRTLCPECRRAAPLGEELVALFVNAGHEVDATSSIYHPVGCESCGDTGYRGRTVISEILIVDDSLRRAVLEGADTPQLRKAAIHGTLRHDGLGKVKAGVTTVEEILRITDQH